MANDRGIGGIARTLAEIAHTLSTGDEARPRLLRALSLVRDLVPCDRCALYEEDPSGRSPISGATLSVPDVAGVDRKRLTARMRGLYEMMSDNGPTDGGVSAHDVPHLAVPVVGLDRTVGVLVVESLGAAYDEHDLRILTVVAAQLGAYLTTVRLRDEEVERARQLAIVVHRLEETDRRKDEFLAMLGHELRNPLGAITTALHLIDHQGRTSEADGRYHRVIDRQIRYLSRIVDDLLDAARVRLGKIVLERRTVDLGSIVRRWLEAFGGTPLAQTRHITIDLPQQPVLVDGDPVRLEQVFSNLATNALKYTGPGARIDVAVSAEGDTGVIRVRDTGIGMTPDFLATVFDLFTQADHGLARAQGGLGLGLPLVRSLVEAHGGTIEATSDGLGEGSEFVVRLPSSPRTEPDLTHEIYDSIDVDGGLRILLVEDNDDIREPMRQLLEAWGHDVTDVADGLKGVEVALRDKPHVAIVDIGMPGMDGYECARRIRLAVPKSEMRLLAMTGYGQPDDRRRALDAGFDLHMVKPIVPDELRRELANVRRPESD